MTAASARPRRGTDTSDQCRRPETSNSHLKRVASLICVCSLVGTVFATAETGPQAGATAPVGQGFTVTPSDLAFILKQIKIAEHHAATTTPATGPCGSLVGPGPDQIPDVLTSYGLRTVDGSCNNLIAGRERFGSADQIFPRLTSPTFRPAESNPPLFGPPGPQTSYAQTNGAVFDTQPRVISNLIVDQTATNPAAIAAAGHPVRAQAGAEGVFPCTTDPTPTSPGEPAGCTPSGETLFIPNVTTDVGLSPPFNSVFTIFGQFFDHGLDKVTNGGSGTVFVPLQADDPLIAGPDHIFNTADDLDPSLRFMVLTRATERPGPDGLLGTADDIHEGDNTDSPWVDLSQAYTSHPSHQVFLRQHELDDAGRPQPTGRLLGEANGTLPTWQLVKAEAAAKLGIALVDSDVVNIPMIAADAYGNFLPGPHGFPQLVTDIGLVEGDPAAPQPVDGNGHFGVRINTAFLNDIARAAVPTRRPDGTLFPDADTVAGLQLDATNPPGSYDDELLGDHFIAGDGRVNENIGLTAIHNVFEHEHNRLVGDIEAVLTADTSPAGVAALVSGSRRARSTAGTDHGSSRPPAS